MIKKHYFHVILISALFVIISNLQLFAQAGKEDVVYLNNGGILRGKIIEYLPDQHVKIETLGGNIWVFQANEILKVTKEDMVYTKSIKKEYIPFEKGFFNYSDFGLLIGRGDYSYYYYYSSPVYASIFTMFGYKFQNRFSAGLGFGPDFLGYPTFPLFADLRYDLNNKKITPVGILQAGYTFTADGVISEDWERDYKGGYLLNAMIGIKSNFSNNSSFVISMGYRRQEQFSTYFNPDLNADINRRDQLNRFTIRLGFEFH